MRTGPSSARGCAVTEALAAQAEAWGYPRKITAREIDEATWFTSALGILWFEKMPAGAEPPPGFGWGVLAIHGIGDPKRTERALSPDTARLIESLGRELGAKKLYALDGPASMPGIKRYLRRYGWLEDKWGAYKVLEG